VYQSIKFNEDGTIKSLMEL